MPELSQVRAAGVRSSDASDSCHSANVRMTHWITVPSGLLSDDLSRFAQRPLVEDGDFAAKSSQSCGESGLRL